MEWGEHNKKLHFSQKTSNTWTYINFMQLHNYLNVYTLSKSQQFLLLFIKKQYSSSEKLLSYNVLIILVFGVFLENSGNWSFLWLFFSLENDFLKYLKQHKMFNLKISKRKIISLLISSRPVSIKTHLIAKKTFSKLKLNWTEHRREKEAKEKLK